MQALVKEFHEAFNLSVNDEPTFKLLELRFNLCAEEHKEATEEMATLAVQVDKKATPEAIRKTKMRLTKELADNLYVIFGTAVTFGLPLEEVFEEVHRSNMSKLGDDGKPVLREDGKVLKGPNYKEADLEQFFV